MSGEVDNFLDRVVRIPSLKLYAKFGGNLCEKLLES